MTGKTFKRFGILAGLSAVALAAPFRSLDSHNGTQWNSTLNSISTAASTQLPTILNSTQTANVTHPPTTSNITLPREATNTASPQLNKTVTPWAVNDTQVWGKNWICPGYDDPCHLFYVNHAGKITWMGPFVVTNGTHPTDPPFIPDHALALKDVDIWREPAETLAETPEDTSEAPETKPGTRKEHFHHHRPHGPPPPKVKLREEALEPYNKSQPWTKEWVCPPGDSFLACSLVLMHHDKDANNNDVHWMGIAVDSTVIRNISTASDPPLNSSRIWTNDEFRMFPYQMIPDLIQEFTNGTAKYVNHGWKNDTSWMVGNGTFTSSHVETPKWMNTTIHATTSLSPSLQPSNFSLPENSTTLNLNKRQSIAWENSGGSRRPNCGGYWPNKERYNATHWREFHFFPFGYEYGKFKPGCELPYKVIGPGK